MENRKNESKAAVTAETADTKARPAEQVGWHTTDCLVQTAERHLCHSLAVCSIKVVAFARFRSGVTQVENRIRLYISQMDCSSRLFVNQDPRQHRSIALIAVSPIGVASLRPGLALDLCPLDSVSDLHRFPNSFQSLRSQVFQISRSNRCSVTRLRVPQTAVVRSDVG